MKMSAGLSKVETKKGFKCNGDCTNCLINKALKSVGYGMKVHIELHAVGAIINRKYYKTFEELRNEYYALYERCKDYKERVKQAKLYQLSQRLKH